MMRCFSQVLIHLFLQVYTAIIQYPCENDTISFERYCGGLFAFHLYDAVSTAQKADFVKRQQANPSLDQRSLASWAAATFSLLVVASRVTISRLVNGRSSSNDGARSTCKTRRSVASDRLETALVE